MFKHKLTDDAELRLIEPRHAEELYALIDANRARLRPWMSFVEHCTSVEAERDFARRALHQFADGRGFHCLIVYKGKLMGGIGMLPMDKENRSTEIGYWLDEQAEGKGLVTASCIEILDLCFNGMKINRVVIRTAKDNERSQAVAKRLGAGHEGMQRQALIIAGALEDLEVFSLLQEEWSADSATTSGAFFTHRLDDETELGLLEPRHAEELFALVDRNREYLRRWLNWVDRTNSADDTGAFVGRQLRQLADNSTIAAGIWHTGTLVGTIGLEYVSAGCMEIGYWISEASQGKGIVTRACEALISRAFDELGVNRVQIRVEPGNDRSRAIPERLGFTPEGTLRQSGMNADWEPVDMLMYSLLKNEWEEQGHVH